MANLPLVIHPLTAETGRGYCTKYNKVKFTRTKSEKFTARKSRTAENFGGTYCIFSSVNGNKYATSRKEKKGILSLFFGTHPEAFHWVLFVVFLSLFGTRKFVFVE